MRVLAVSVLIMAMLIGLGSFNYYYFSSTAEDLSAKMNVIEEKVQQGDWGSAGQLTSEFQSSWSKVSNKWQVLIDHHEIDQINTSVSRIDKFIETRDLSSFMAELAELKLLIEHIPAKEALNIRNIL